MTMDPAMAVLAEYPLVMTPAEVAKALRISPTGVRTLAARGELPGHKIGREWRFLRSDIAAKLGARLDALPQAGVTVDRTDG